MQKKSEYWMKKKILVKALSKNLEKMSRSPWVRSLKDGKDLVCPHCNQPVKPCLSNPDAMCEHMLRSGTVGKQLEEALKECEVNQYGVCLACGKKMSTTHLKKHPTAEICPHCVQKEHKVRLRKTAHS